ncbi:MAG: polysaccharide deacetylase family protein, partial [Rectinemataceae bacterium]|nr:polysaccharide deacetylase family protein [Rectinemataceae bacterium]
MKGIFNKPIVLMPVFASFMILACSTPGLIRVQDSAAAAATSTVAASANPSILPPEGSVLPDFTGSYPARSDPKVVVLMYHNLVYGRPSLEYDRSVENFMVDLAYLRERYPIIDFYDLERIKAGTARLNADAVILTFDDGDLSIYGLAYPLLGNYNFKATFFLISDFVGKLNYVKWDQVRSMAAYRNAAGARLFTFGSHSKSHVPLKKALDEKGIAALVLE